MAKKDDDYERNFAAAIIAIVLFVIIGVLADVSMQAESLCNKSPAQQTTTEK